MSNPKHPPKIVAKIKGGLVEFVSDKPVGDLVRIFVADYDLQGDGSGVDFHGERRELEERWPYTDTAEVRHIINKGGNPISQARGPK